MCVDTLFVPQRLLFSVFCCNVKFNHGTSFVLVLTSKSLNSFNVRRTVTKLCTDIHDSLRMNPTDFGESPDFPSSVISGLTFVVLSEMAQQLLDRLLCNLADSCLHQDDELSSFWWSPDFSPSAIIASV